MDIKALPVERATLKVLFTADDSSDSTLDTSSLPSSNSGDSVKRPDSFPVPQFSHGVELQLREVNYRYTKDGSVIVIPKGSKTDILDMLADSMLQITDYPERDHYESVAKALVEKRPCLREPGQYHRAAALESPEGPVPEKSIPTVLRRIPARGEIDMSCYSER